LVEESAIIPKNKRYKISNMTSDNLKRNNCGKNNHVTSRFFLKGKMNVRVNQFSARHESQWPSRNIIYSEKGHIAQEYKRHKKKTDQMLLKGNLEVTVREKQS
jgi:hypothetical protein